MARAIPCDICETESAVLLQSNLSEGGTVAVGPACITLFSVGAALAMTELVPPEERSVLRPYVEQMATAVDVTAIVTWDVKPSPKQERKRGGLSELAHASADRKSDEPVASGSSADAPTE